MKQIRPVIQSYLNGLRPTVFIFEGPHIKRVEKTHKAMQSRKNRYLKNKMGHFRSYICIFVLFVYRYELQCAEITLHDYSDQPVHPSSLLCVLIVPFALLLLNEDILHLLFPEWEQRL